MWLLTVGSGKSVKGQPLSHRTPTRKIVPKPALDSPLRRKRWGLLLEIQALETATGMITITDQKSTLLRRKFISFCCATLDLIVTAPLNARTILVNWNYKNAPASVEPDATFSRLWLILKIGSPSLASLREALRQYGSSKNNTSQAKITRTTSVLSWSLKQAKCWPKVVGLRDSDSFK